ncbi:MAG: hypothetical protein I3J02_07075 [Prevotella sp.]|nr:hypothetical protein [Prevotella sp.]
MKRKHLRIFLLAAAFTAAGNAVAVERPSIATTPVDGGVYILMNYAQPNLFWSTTPWDGSYYLLSYADSNWRKATFIAHQDADGWYFVTADSTYVGYGMGDANLKGNLASVAHYELTTNDAYPGYYRIVSGADQTNPLVVGLPIHLNSSGQYVVSTFSGNQWYPDYMGGVETIPETGDPSIDPATNWIIGKETSHEYWAFADTTALEAYHFKSQLYVDIQALTANVSDPVYGTGYQGTIDAVSAMYDKADFGETDLVAAEALINAKQGLKDLIASGIEALGSSTDATLTAAINTATQDYNTKNSTEEITAATETLTKAIADYKKGMGDISYMGTNLSFEDMSAQGGVEHSDVAATPAGWTALTNGRQASTTDELKAAGYSAWYGVNSDAEGALDGKVAFGIWNSGMPTFQLSQTFTGLANGTYTVTAALMAGANSAASRLTSQRIFGNLNSTLFGPAEQYDATQLPSEVLSYAGYDDEATDRMLRDVSVDAYVYDGTLTFGLKTDGNLKTAKRTSSNPSGGDGWFKVDNFRIVSKGYVADDAMNVLYHFEDALNSALNYMMQAEINDTAFAYSEKYASVTSASSEEDINDAIVTLKNFMPEVQSSVAAYQKLSEAMTAHGVSYNLYKAYEGAQEYWNVIEAAQIGYDNGSFDEAGVTAAIKAMDDALANCKKNGVKVGGELTNLIANPSFEDLSAQGNVSSAGLANPPAGWTLVLDGDTITGLPTGKVANWCAINEGDAINVQLEDGTVITSQPTDGTHLWGIWTSNVPEVELSQTLTGMPAGTYLLKADVMVQNNWAGNNITNQRIFGNDCVQMWAKDYNYSPELMPADAKIAYDFDQLETDTLRHLTYAAYTCESGDATTSLLKPMKVRFGVQTDGVLKLGFRTNGISPDGTSYGNGSTVNGLGWFKVDNFRLYYESTTMQTSGVNDIEAASEVVGQKYYSVDGREISKPHRGIAIVKTKLANGSVKVQKTIVK